MAVFILALLAVAAFATPVPFELCDKKAKYPVKLTKMDAEPWPPVPGEKMHMTIAGNSNTTITGGTWTADIYMGEMKLITKNGEICKTEGVKCPLKKGPFKQEKDIDFPSQVPAGEYKLVFTAVDQKKVTLICFSIKMTIGGISDAQRQLWQWGMAALDIADEDHWSQIAHDFLKGFFQGLNRDGKDLIDHLKDPTQYLQRDDLFNFLMAIKGIKENPKDISRYVTAFTASGKLLGSLHDAVVAVGDARDSEKLKALIADFKNISQLKNLVLPMLVDPLFHQDIRELVSVFGCVRSGDCAWSDLGLKLGELFHTIISHA